VGGLVSKSDQVQGYVLKIDQLQCIRIAVDRFFKVTSSSDRFYKRAFLLDRLFIGRIGLFTSPLNKSAFLTEDLRCSSNHVNGGIGAFFLLEKKGRMLEHFY